MQSLICGFLDYGMLYGKLNASFCLKGMAGMTALLIVLEQLSFRYKWWK